MREVLFLGGAIGIVMMALTQAKSSLRSNVLELEPDAAVADLEPIQSLNIDRDHQRLVVHSRGSGIEEIRLSDGHSVNQDPLLGCEAVETSEINSTSIQLHRWIEGSRTILGVSIMKQNRNIVFAEFDAQSDAIGDVRISSDGSLAMLVFHSGKVVTWDTTTAEPVRGEYTLPMRAPCNRLSSAGDLLFVVGNDGGSLICDSRTGEVRTTMPAVVECCRRAAWSRDSRYLAVGTHRGTIHVYETLTGKLIWECCQELAFSQFIRFSMDGNLLATSGCDSKIRIWNIKNPGTAPVVLEGSSAMIRDFVFTDSDKKLVSGCADGTIREWSIASREVTRQLR